MSPFSAQSALSILYTGAGGQTLQAMAKGLDFENDTQTEVATQFQALLQQVQQDQQELTIANALYIMQGYNIQPAYQATARTDFNASVETVNFAQSQAAASTINNWVSDETHGKITNLISPDALSSDTRMVIVNAIYFKGTWVHQFDKSETYLQNFNANGNCQSSSSGPQVEMMHMTVSI